MGTGYTLVICEKPDAAKRVANALSGGGSRIELVDGTTAFRFVRKGEEFVVCSAQGHVYGVSDPLDERTVYPVFDVEWYSSDLLDEDSAGAARCISAIRRLAAGACRFVNACDFDVEGETIGFNLLRYACGGKEKGALRAKFSTLTEGDLNVAFDNLSLQAGQGLARAGRARHAIDFVWGVNLSRALSQSALGSGHRYSTVSVGRVQGPTLAYLVDREREIRGFVPLPYWRVTGVFERNGKRITAAYSNERVRVASKARRIHDECAGREAVVKSVKRVSVLVGPPPPFSIGDLQKEAYRAYGFTPSRTMQLAERLYLAALVSYPRTSSQRLPPSIGYRRIIQDLGKTPAYSATAAEILKGEPRPVHGGKSDPAHPAIHPTGEGPRRPLDRSEAALLDLVARRFLATFGPPARRELVGVSIAVGEHEFNATGDQVVFSGWMKYYGKLSGYRDEEPPDVSEGDLLAVADVPIEEKFDQNPPRYNQGTLLEKMERDGIGTRATRADIISTLVQRGYVTGESMEATELGMSVVETMEKYAPSIIETRLTHNIEERLEAVEGGVDGESALLREMVRSIAGQLADLGDNEEAVGRGIGSALMSTMARTFALSKCPVCKKGELRVIRSRTTKKRFVGCSNYQSGCRASAPLPRKGSIRAAAKPCDRCSWPVVYVSSGALPWRLCINPECPGKARK